MRKVNVTEFRQHLPDYIKKVQQGELIQITLHGRAVARLIPDKELKEEAIKALSQWRTSAEIDDIVSPIEEVWEADYDRL